MIGDRDAAKLTDGDCVRGHPLVRKAVQGEVLSSRGFGVYTDHFFKKPDARSEKCPRRFPCDRTVECVLQVVYDGSGGLAA